MFPMLDKAVLMDMVVMVMEVTEVTEANALLTLTLVMAVMVMATDVVLPLITEVVPHMLGALSGVLEERSVMPMPMPTLVMAVMVVMDTDVV